VGQAGEVVGEVVTSGYQPSVTARQTTLIPDFQAAPAVAITPNEHRKPDLEYRRVAVKSEEDAAGRSADWRLGSQRTFAGRD